MRTVSGIQAKAGRHTIGVEVRTLDGRTFAALGSELTTDTIFVSTFQEVALGTEVIVEIALREGTVHVEGSIDSLRDGPPGFVVRFDQIAERGKQIVARAIAVNA